MGVVTCPTCRQAVSVLESQQGQPVACPHCRRPIAVPFADEPPRRGPQPVAVVKLPPVAGCAAWVVVLLGAPVLLVFALRTFLEVVAFFAKR